MACNIDIRSLVAPGGTHANGYYEVTSIVWAPGSSPTTVKRNGCGGTSVGINSGMTAAQLTNAIFGATGGKALNSLPAGNFNICFDTTKKLTLNLRYTIDDGVCDPNITNFSVEVRNGCQFLLTPGGAGGGCDNAIQGDYGQEIPLDGPNGLTNGIPWATITARAGAGKDCSLVKLTPIPATYALPGGGTGNWIDRVNLTTGEVEIPEEGFIKCGEPCVQIRIETTPQYTANQAGCDDCDSGPASLFILPPDYCTPALANGSRVQASSTVDDGAPVLQLDVISITIDFEGSAVVLGSYNALFTQSGGVWSASQTVVNQIGADITQQIVNKGCAEGCVTLWALPIPPDGPGSPWTFILNMYICDSCGVELVDALIEGENQSVSVLAHTTACPTNPGGDAKYYSNC